MHTFYVFKNLILIHCGAFGTASSVLIKGGVLISGVVLCAHFFM